MKIENCKAYELIQQETLEDLGSQGYVLCHKKTGAKVALISNQDPNKVFAIGFRTPSQDSTGVAHIVEHTVLCGSKKFPVKDPFVELVKGSLNTFLNAITYPDKTIYPVASLNDTDFKNLMDVYLDAVFHPNIYHYQEIFQQEGWHYELEDPESPITINGVVYNEMKGAFSSPEGVLERQVLNALYPDTSYQYESGGDPQEIPKLTYQGFLDFHSRFYHPSNSYIYLYGDMDMEEKLNWLDQEYLAAYEHQEIDSRIKTQEPFQKPVEVQIPYSVASNEPLEDNTYLSCNFSVDTILNPKYYIAFDILDYVLLGAPGAPLKKALLDAGICKDVVSSYDNSIYQPIFSITVKNSNLHQKEEFLAIVKRVLQEQKSHGLNKRSLQAGLNSLEFKYREADFGQFPKGLMYGIQCLDSWLYADDEPFTHLKALKVIEWLKQQIETDYFEQLIDTYLLKNQHVAIVSAVPQRGLNTQQEKELQQELAEYKASLSQEEIQQLVEETHGLRKYQEEPSTQEELMTIPMLSRADLKREAEPFSNEERNMDDIPVLFHDVDSNGIAYLNLLFDTSELSLEDIPYLGVLKAVLGYVDTENYSYSELANEVNLHTGGINSVVSGYAKIREEQYETKFEIRIKSLYDKVPKALELVEEILIRTSLADSKRIYEILAQLKTRLKSSLSASGHSISAMRAMSYFSPGAKYTDMTGGIDFYQMVSHLEENYQQEKEALAQKLQQLIVSIFRKEKLLVSLGSQPQGYDAVAPCLENFAEQLYTQPIEGHREVLVCQKKNEGFMDASQVQYVSRAGNFRRKGFAYTGELQILKVILSYEYLWQKIRVKGGAYGCMTGFTRMGDAYFTSYRDPKLEETNEVYEGTAEYLRNFQIEERDMTKYVIGTFSNLDIPLTPATQAQRSLNSYLTGVGLQELQQERDQILAADQESIRCLADLVQAVLDEQALCVIGNEDRLKEHEEMFWELKSLS